MCKIQIYPWQLISAIFRIKPIIGRLSNTHKLLLSFCKKLMRPVETIKYDETMYFIAI